MSALIDRLTSRRIGRRVVLGGLTRALPRRFDPGAAEGLDAVFELKVLGANGGEPDRYELEISGGHCVVRRPPRGRADSTVTIGAADLVRLAAGTASWPQLLGSHRLVLEGDPFLAVRFPALFRLPARARS